MKVIAFILLSITAQISQSENMTPYQKTKSFLKMIYRNTPTFYCQCPFDTKSMQIKDIRSCSSGPVQTKKLRPGFRATDVNWEHLLPVLHIKNSVDLLSKRHLSHQILHTLEKARAEATVAHIKSDPHNLVPTHAQTNYVRGHKKLLPLENFDFKTAKRCGLQLNRTHAEPNESLRGWIARAHLYMQNAYPKYIQFKESETKIYQAWHMKNPPSQKEIEIIHKMEQIWAHTPKNVDYFKPDKFISLKK